VRVVDEHKRAPDIDGDRDRDRRADDERHLPARLD